MKRLMIAFVVMIGFLVTSVVAQDEDIKQMLEMLDAVEQANKLPVNFEPGTAKLTRASEMKLQQQAALFKKLPAGIIIEIGAHVPRGKNEPANLRLTEARAEAVRRFLRRYRLETVTFQNRGYGSSEPETSNPADKMNDRVKYSILKSPITLGEPAEPKASANAIVAGKGWGKVILGATKNEIDAVLGKPEIFDKDSFNPEQSYSTFYSKGLVVIYKTSELRAIKLRFIGDAPLYGARADEFKSFAGTPDKGLVWGASAAQVIAAYGAPLKRDAYPEYGTNREILNLHYPNIHFVLKADKLFQINLEQK